MLHQNQKSLAKAVTIHGKGLHSGRMVRLEIHPASANYGIRFLRTDVDRAEIIPALYTNITATELCTTVGSGSNSVATIEHLLAALVGLGIDNALVRVNGPEIPIMDGSSRPFISAFTKAGVVDLGVGKKYFIVKDTFEFSSGGRTIKIEPARELSYVCEIDFGKSFIGRQRLEMTMSEANFLKLADARTFCHLNEVNALRSIGLAQGGSLENAVVVTDTGVMNEEGLRSDDEFVRHKLLDCIGDFALMGGTIIGKITVSKPGHGFHAEVMNQLMLHRSQYLTVITPANAQPAVHETKKLAVVGGSALAFS